jgi:hypothetical protein
VKPQNFEERVVWYSIVGTYGFFLLGGLYILAPVVAWVLLAYLGWKWWNQDSKTDREQRITVPVSVWVWVVAMVVMQLALVIGHLDFNLETSSLIKSSIGWAKGWALLALFPLIGCLAIRPQVLYRATCIVCLHTLLVLPFFVLGYLLHLPDRLYVSPLQAIGGPGPEFFSVQLYEIDPENNQVRFRLFTPWGPALGFVANIYFFIALQEKDKKWRWIGIAGCLIMCLISASRLALLSIVTVLVSTWVLTNFKQPKMQIALGFASLVAGIASPQILAAIESFNEAFRGARAGSSRVRAALGRIALDRWQKEAPIWGHGVVERGPHLVEYMPIGSHHTWFGLLFVKGAVGFVALAVPLLWSFVDLLIKAQKSDTARTGLSIVLVLFLYTFGENLEILAYLFWPGLVMLGLAFKEGVQLPRQQVSGQTPNISLEEAITE